MLVYRRRAEGGFAAEAYSGIDTIIILPEISADLSLADLYDGIDYIAPPCESDRSAASGR